MSERFDDFMRRLLKTKSVTDIAALSMERNLRRDLTAPLAFPEGKSLRVIRPLTAFSRVTLKVDIDIPVNLKVGDEVFCSGRDLLSQLFLVYRGNVAAFAKDRVTDNYQHSLLSNTSTDRLYMFIHLPEFGGPENI